MTAATLSAYPRTVDELLPEAVEMAEQMNGVPSRNQLMRAFKVGAPKATELRERLLADLGPSATDHTPVPAPSGGEPDPLPVEAESVPEDVSDSEPVAESDPDPVEPMADLRPLAAPDGHPDTPATSDPHGEALEAVRYVSAVKLARLAARANRGNARQQVRHVVMRQAPARTEMALKVVPPPAVKQPRKPLVWPVLLLSVPAFVSIWSGWVELGGLAGFGIVHPLPGIADEVTFNTAITLPIGVETYAAYALWVWLSGRAPRKARRFAKWSALGSLVFGGAGQIAYHLLTTAGVTAAPWQITSAVACLPVAVLGMGAALAHLMHADHNDDEDDDVQV